MDAQTKKDVEKILSGEATVDASGKLIGAPDRSVPVRIEPIPPALSYDPEKIDAFVQNREHAKATRRLMNLRSTVRMVEDELIEQAKLEGEEKVPETPPKVDPDLLFRWAAAVEEISNEDMQRLWARVLAKESQRPGSFSLRTLEVLRAIKRSEAELIEKAAKLAIDGNFILKDDKLVARYIGFGELMVLQDLGILSGLGSMGGVNRTIGVARQDSGDFAAVIMFHGNIAILAQTSTVDSIPLPCYPLTGVGKEIIRLCRTSADLEYLYALGHHVRKLRNVTKVQWAIVRPVPEGDGVLVEATFELPNGTGTSQG
ncbi:DUF2806 domain-containing protein [Reyranella sp. CPCC 100927]|uniref:DUF2806 domain-containing protein n=1 Tax=Reyranella sp. CPCC 100927 TaxID=2599616 RepID=UPI0015B44AE9|nr:DUF2806 domain-containing protein [Reyranella sp. CPCC 100927]